MSGIAYPDPPPSEAEICAPFSIKREEGKRFVRTARFVAGATAQSIAMPPLTWSVSPVT